MDKNRLGLDKKSFELNYDGGTIWAEHLDSITDIAALKEKFLGDLKIIARPSRSGFIALNMDETPVDTELADFVTDGLCSVCKNGKRICKVAFVGLSSEIKRHIRKQSKAFPFAIAFIDDYEKAKHWLLFGDD